LCWKLACMSYPPEMRLVSSKLAGITASGLTGVLVMRAVR